MTGLREAVAHDVPTLLKKWGHILPFDSLANSAQYSVFSRKGFVCHKRESRCDESLVASG